MEGPVSGLEAYSLVFTQQMVKSLPDSRREG
jgi:hypothetical protein